jgi:hypothetical protein
MIDRAQFNYCTSFKSFNLHSDGVWVGYGGGNGTLVKALLFETNILENEEEYIANINLHR